MVSIIEKVNFITAVSYPDRWDTTSEYLLERVDDFFFIEGRKFHVLHGEKDVDGSQAGVYVNEKCSLGSTAFKIVLYCTVIIPLIALIFKAMLRSIHAFHTVNPLNKIQDNNERNWLENSQSQSKTVIPQDNSVIKPPSSVSAADSNPPIQPTSPPIDVVKQPEKDVKEASSKINEDLSQKQIAAAVRIAGRILGKYDAETKRDMEEKALADQKAQADRDAKIKLEQEEKERNKLPAHRLFEQLKVSKKTIEDGYGEYVIFHPDARPPVQKTFEAAYKLMNQLLAPSNSSSSSKETGWYDSWLVDHKPIVQLCQDPSKMVMNKPTLIREAIKKVDNSLDVAFIPRTLYELVFLRQSIMEELEDGASCSLLNVDGYNAFKDYLKGENEEAESYFMSKLEKCWHICCFTDKDNSSNDHVYVRELAFQMNSLLVKELHIKGSLTGEQISEFAKSELSYFIDHYKWFHYKRERFGLAGTAINFGRDTKSYNSRLICWPMCIRNDVDAQVIYNSIALECHEIAQNSFILYRAGNFLADGEISEKQSASISLSFGTSLFAGSLRDGNATVFYYTRNKEPGEARDTYATVVPYRDYNENCPYYIPVANAICQLSSRGEFFHARSKLTVNTSKEEYTRGIYGTKDKPQHLISSFTAQQLSVRLNQNHSNAWLLARK